MPKMLGKAANPCLRQTGVNLTTSVEIMPSLRRRSNRAEVAPATPHLFAPTGQRPVRCKHTTHAADTRVVPHRHPWAQLAYSSVGVMRVEAAQGTFMAPPSRAVWIPPGVEHAVTAVEHSHYHTLYLDQPPPHPPRDGQDWHHCRVLEVTDLLRAVILALDARSDAEPPPSPLELARERHLVAVLHDELSSARPVPLGLPMPRDKRLHQLCAAILDDPARHTTLAAWATDAGASERTLARLFRAELGTSYARWRQQALIARAMVLAAAGHPMNHIASALGYASPSAFSAMVRRELGASPRQMFFGSRASQA